ncbi:SDR family NAD(P)-dependent oxidoreductase [Paenibacillus sp. TH7-28]
MSEFTEFMLNKVAAREIAVETAFELLKAHQLDMESQAASVGRDPIHEDIAVIGLSCRFSGADDPGHFWVNLTAGLDSVTEVPSERWDSAAFYSSERGIPFKSYSKWGSFLDSIEDFDPEFFGMKTSFANLTDPQQRLFLILCWEVLEHAGYGSRRSREGHDIGVFAGARGNAYQVLEEMARQTPEQRNRKDYIELARAGLLGKAPNMIAAAISNVMDLSGPSIVLDTACSSSLVSVHMACQSLRSGECQMAIAGGVDLLLTPETYIMLSQINAMSPEGKCKTFDTTADGYVPGEGGGAVLLKPLSSALADGDTVYAVIKGSAVNNDGYTVGVTTPDVSAQKKVIRAALEQAGVNPEVIGMIEAHGTGTFLGDPIEVRALTEVYRDFTTKSNFCALGTVKSNLGHLHSAAGIASFIKTVLSLHHQTIPPTLHCQRPNPRFGLVTSPFYVASRTEEWRSEFPRLAAVSSFGFGGTNCHMIIGEAEQPLPGAAPGPEDTYLLTLSARNEASLYKMIERYKEVLERISDQQFPDFCHTANNGRESFEYRLAVVCEGRSDAIDKLERARQNPEGGFGIDGNSKIHMRTSGHGEETRVAFLFPGQGAQYPGMCRELYQTQRHFMEAFDACADLFAPWLGFNITDLIFKGDADNGHRSASLSDTAITQPLVFSIGYAMAKMWMAAGITPSAVLGHSVGEYAAACIAGVLNLPDAVKLIAERGRLMQSLRVDGGMMVAFAGYERINQFLEHSSGRLKSELSIAAINSPGNTVLSGTKSGLADAAILLGGMGITCRELSVSHPFHSPLMSPMLDAFDRVLDTVQFHPPEIDIVSNVTGSYLRDFDKGYWKEHVLQPVQFQSGIHFLRDDGCSILLEAGPGTTLTTMVKDMGVELPVVSTLTPFMKDADSLKKASAELFVNGAAPCFQELEREGLRHKISIPLYPFQLRKYWAEQQWHLSASSAKPAGVSTETLDGMSVYECQLDSADPLLRDHRVNGEIVFPAVCYWQLVRNAVRFVFGDEAGALRNVVHLFPLILKQGQSVKCRVELASGRSFRILSRQADIDKEWILHTTGEYRLGILTAPASLPIKQSLDDFARRVTAPISGGEMLAELRRKGLEYGALFSGLQTLWPGGQSAFAEIDLGEAAAAALGPEYILPALIDAALQSITGVNSIQHEDGPYMPFSAEEIQYFALPGFKGYAIADNVEQSAGGTIVRADVRLLDINGNVCVFVQGLRVKKKESGTTATESMDKSDWFYAPYWVRTPLSPTANDNEEVRSVVVFCDPQQIQSVGNKLGDTPIIPVFSGQDFVTDCKDRGYFTINPRNPDHYELLFRQIRQQHGEIAGIINLWSLLKDGTAGLERLENSQYSGCISILHTVKAVRNSFRQPLFIQAATCCAFDVTGDETELLSEQATLLGILRTIPLEYGNIFCSLLDVERGMTFFEIWHRLKEERQNKDGVSAVAVRGGERYVREIQQIRQSVLPASPISFKHNGVYMIAGGLGGLGLEVAKHIAERAETVLIMINRSYFPPRESWEDAGRSHPEIAAKIKKILEIEAAGSRVVIMQGDICDQDAMVEIVSRIKLDFGQINGVIHSALVLKDSLIRNMTEADMWEAMKPKLHGTWILDKVTQNEQLDFFILFSGMITFFANAGQGNYMSGSLYKDQFARSRARKGNGRTLVINWGIWGEAGIVADPFYTASLSAKGIRPMLTEEGIAAFDVSMRLGEVQVGIAPLEKKELVIQTKAISNDPLAGLSAEEKEESPMQKENAVETSLVSEFRLEERIKALLVSKIAKLLLREETSLDTKASFLDMGLDSLGIVLLTEHFEQELGLKIYPTLFFEYPTLPDLSKYLIQHHREALISLFSSKADSEAVLALDEFRHSGMSSGKEEEVENIEETLPQSGGMQRDSVKMKGNSGILSEDGLRECDIAIIGVSGRFPGADNINDFWHNLRDGIESVGEIPGRIWNTEDYYDTNRRPGKTYCKKAGLVEGIDNFDPLFFNISPKEAAYMDPQQRLALMTAWEALEDAGYGGGILGGTTTGVFVGVSNNNYFTKAFDPDVSCSGLGNSNAIIANRISHFMNFAGPSVSLETQCSSSLVAIYNACLSLQAGDCEHALAGGVNLIVKPDYYVLLSQMEALSPDGRCHAFDKRANGFVDGEGVGFIVLKKAKDALRDRDPIYAIIKSVHVNHGARSVSLTAPSARSQADLIRTAIHKAEVPADTITYLEAHGTGTALGDPIEINGIRDAFASLTPKQGFCALGAVKTNIGHLEAAAGIAGVIKVLLAMKHKQIPASLHFNEPNPYIPFVDSPIYIADTTTRWETEGSPRRAGVSSFGMGGTNAHVILEEAPESTEQLRRPGDEVRSLPRVVTFSAKTQTALERYVDRFVKFLGVRQPVLEDISYTLNIGRGHFPYRLAVVVDDTEELLHALKSVTLGDGSFGRHNGLPKVYGSFPFGGKESISPVTSEDEAGVGMYFPDWRSLQPMLAKGYGRQLYQSLSEFRHAVDECIAAVNPYSEGVQQYFQNVNFNPASTSADERILSFIVQYSLFRVLCQWGVCFTHLKGDGTGKATVAAASGSLSPKSAANDIAAERHSIEHPPAIAPGLTEPAATIVAGPISQLTFGEAKLFIPMVDDKADEIQGIMTAVARLYVLGVSIDWDRFNETSDGARINLPTYAFDMRSCWISSGTERKSEIALAIKSTGREAEAESSPVLTESDMIFRWKWHELGALKTGALKSGGVWLLFEDDRGIAADLERKLEAEGQYVIKICPGDAFSKTDSGNYSLDPSNVEHYRHMLSCALEDYGSVHGIIHLWMCSTEYGGSYDKEALERDLQLGVYSLCFLGQALHSVRLKNRVGIVTVSADQALFSSGTAEYLPHAGAVRSAALSLSEEIPNVYAVTVDVSLPEMSVENISLAVTSEIKALQPSKEAVYRGGKRHRRILVPAVKSDYETGRRRLVKPGGIYLITGGLGGLGATMAEVLVQQGAGLVLLTGSQPLPPRAEWDRLIRSEDRGGTAAKIKRLLRLEKFGDVVRYGTVDISDKQAMLEWLRETIGAFGRIDGVIHCAGTREDALLSGKTPESIRRVCRPKIHGLAALAELFRHDRPEYMILFSSIASLYGRAGQADYAAANAFMDGAGAVLGLESRQKVISVNWPYWEGGGMVLEPRLAERLKEDGLLPLTDAEGVKLLNLLVRIDNINGNVAVLKLKDRERFLSELERMHEGYNFGLDIVVKKVTPPLPVSTLDQSGEGKAPAPGSDALCKQSHAGGTLTYLTDLFTGLLGLDPGELEPDLELGAYGIDSLMMKDALYRLEQYTGAAVDPSCFEEYPSIGQLSAYLDRRYFGESPRYDSLGDEEADIQKDASSGTLEAEDCVLRLQNIFEGLYEGRWTTSEAKSAIFAILADKYVSDGEII